MNRSVDVVWKCTRKRKQDIEGTRKSHCGTWKKDCRGRYLTCSNATVALGEVEFTSRKSRVGFPQSGHRLVWNDSAVATQKKGREKGEGDHCQQRQHRGTEAHLRRRHQLKRRREMVEESKVVGYEEKENKRRHRPNKGNRRRQRRVRWWETRTWWKGKHRSKKVEALEKRGQPLLMRR